LNQSGQERLIPLADKIAYGSGNIATGVAMQVLGTYLVFYSTAVLGLPGSIVGLVMGLSIFWDALTDPLIGYVSDNTPQNALGKRHPYLLAGAFGVALTNYLIWNMDPAFGQLTKLVLITVYILLFKSFMTVYVTPYTALGAELSTDYNERTTIQGIKSVFFILGLAFVSVAGLYWFFKPSSEFPVGQLNPDSYGLMGLASSVLVLISAAACFGPTLKYVPVIRTRRLAFPHVRPANLRASLGRLLANRPFRLVVLAYMFSNLASALLANLGLMVFTFTFAMGSAGIATVVGIQFLCAILAQPVWAWRSRRRGKKRALIEGVAVSIAGSLYFAVLVLLHPEVAGRVVAFLPFSISAGFGIGALFTLPLSMVADTVDLDEARGGTRIEGLYFGTLTLMYKLSQALVLVGIGILLDVAGFNSALPVQGRNTLLVLGLVLGLGSAVSFVAAAICLLGYDLDEAAVNGCRERIAVLQAGGDVPDGEGA